MCKHLHSWFSTSTSLSYTYYFFTFMYKPLTLSFNNDRIRSEVRDIDAKIISHIDYTVSKEGNNQPIIC